MNITERLSKQIIAFFSAIVLFSLTLQRAEAQAVVRSSSSYGAGGSAATSCSISKPSGLTAGDLMVMSVAVEGSSTVLNPTGWTRRILQQESSNFSLCVFWKIATSADAAASSFTVNFGSSGKHSVGLTRITGHNPTAPIVASASSQQPAASNLVIAPSVTTTAANQLVLGFHAVKKSATFTASYGTERYDVSADPPSHAMFSYVKATAGSTGSKTATSSEPETYAAAQIAIASAPTATPTSTPSVSTTPEPTAVAARVIAVPADPEFSEISISTVSLPATAAASATITVRLFDAEGVPLTTGGNVVSIYQIVNGLEPGTRKTVTDNGNGTYSATVTGAAAAAGDLYEFSAYLSAVADETLLITGGTGAELEFTDPSDPFDPFDPNSDPGTTIVPVVGELGSGVVRRATRAALESAVVENDSVIVVNLSFAGLNLSAINLFDAYVRNVNFNGANLTDASFTDFNNFIPVNIDLPGQSSPSFVLDEYLANTNWALTFRGANLTRAKFSDVYMAGSDFSSLPDKITRLDAAMFDDSYFANANFTGVSAVGAGFVGADLRNATFRNAILTDASFVGADLTNADLSGASLLRVSFNKAILNGVNLSGADLRNANLTEVDFSGANLSGANLAGADLGKTNLSGVNLTGANLRGAKLLEADLSGARLVSSDFTGADLSKANFSGAILGSGAQRAIFTGALRVDTIGLVLNGNTTPDPDVTPDPNPVLGPVDPGQSVVSISSDFIPANGVSKATITVELRNALGARLTRGGNRVSIFGTATLGTAGVISPVVDNGNGTYTATVTSSSDSTTVMTFAAYLGLAANSNNEIKGGSGVGIQFVPVSSYPDLTKSTIRVSSNQGSIDGVSPVTVVVSLKNANGGAYLATPTVGGPTLYVRTNFGTLDQATTKLSMDPQSGTMQPGQFPGTYVASLTSDQVGVATIDAFFGLDENAPKVGTVSVTYDGSVLIPSLLTSEVSISSDIMPATPDAQAVVSVTLKDATGRPLRSGGESVSIYQSSEGSASLALHWP